MRERGFTLIEIMIVVTILSILLMIALPSYQRSLVRSTRADAQAALMGFAQAMERHYQTQYSYEEAAAGGSDTGAPDASVFPDKAPLDGEKFYDLSITEATATAYTLRATPISAKRQGGDGIMTLNSLGQRGWDADNDGTISAAEQTWER